MSSLSTCLEPPTGAHHLPIRISAGTDRRVLEQLGWRFPERCSTNPDWWHATPPNGWTETHEHLRVGDGESSPMSIFIDAEHRERLHVWGAGGGKAPYAEVISFITMTAFDDPQSNTSTVEVRGGGVTLQKFSETITLPGNETQETLKAQARAWCGQHYPLWHNPHAYWE